MATHKITITGSFDDEDLSFLTDACEGNLSSQLAVCLVRVLKDKKIEISKDIDNLIFIHERPIGRYKDGGTEIYEVLNPKDANMDSIRYDGRRNKPTSGMWLHKEDIISEDRIRKVDRYKYKK